MAEAKDAMFEYQYGKTLKLYADALDLKPHDPQAATLCGTAACYMKKGDLAKKYHAVLPPQRQTMIRHTCLKNGLPDDF